MLGPGCNILCNAGSVRNMQAFSRVDTALCHQCHTYVSIADTTIIMIGTTLYHYRYHKESSMNTE